MDPRRRIIWIVCAGVVPMAIVAMSSLWILFDRQASAPTPEPEPPREASLPPVVEEVDADADAAPPEESRRRIWHTTNAFVRGTLILDRKALEARVLEPDELDPDMLSVAERGADAIAGTAIARNLEAGEILRVRDLVGPDEARFVPLILAPGMRAVAVRVGPATAFAGLVEPGMSVDVIWTGNLSIDRQHMEVETHTLFEDARVLAVDHSTRFLSSGETVEREPITTVLLQVTRKQARCLALAEHEGELTLAIRAWPSTITGDMSRLVALPVPVNDDESECRFGHPLAEEFPLAEEPPLVEELLLVEEPPLVEVTIWRADRTDTVVFGSGEAGEAPAAIQEDGDPAGRDEH